MKCFDEAFFVRKKYCHNSMKIEEGAIEKTLPAYSPANAMGDRMRKHLEAAVFLVGVQVAVPTPA